jgi:hypothetical protein
LPELRASTELGPARRGLSTSKLRGARAETCWAFARRTLARNATGSALSRTLAEAPALRLRVAGRALRCTLPETPTLRLAGWRFTSAREAGTNTARGGRRIALTARRAEAGRALLLRLAAGRTLTETPALGLTRLHPLLLLNLLLFRLRLHPFLFLHLARLKLLSAAFLRLPALLRLLTSALLADALILAETRLLALLRLRALELLAAALLLTDTRLLRLLSALIRGASFWPTAAATLLILLTAPLRLFAAPLIARLFFLLVALLPLRLELRELHLRFGGAQISERDNARRYTRQEKRHDLFR